MPCELIGARQKSCHCGLLRAPMQPWMCPHRYKMCFGRSFLWNGWGQMGFQDRLVSVQRSLQLVWSKLQLCSTITGPTFTNQKQPGRNSTFGAWIAIRLRQVIMGVEETQRRALTIILVSADFQNNGRLIGSLPSELGALDSLGKEARAVQMQHNKPFSLQCLRPGRGTCFQK